MTAGLRGLHTAARVALTLPHMATTRRSPQTFRVLSRTLRRQLGWVGPREHVNNVVLRNVKVSPQSEHGGKELLPRRAERACLRACVVLLVAGNFAITQRRCRTALLPTARHRKRARCAFNVMQTCPHCKSMNHRRAALGHITQQFHPGAEEPRSCCCCCSCALTLVT